MLCQSNNAQKLFLKINGGTISENQTIDSLNYTQTHSNFLSIEKEIVKVSKSLNQLGYLEHQKKELIKKNDSVYAIAIDLKKQIKHSLIYIGKNFPLRQLYSTKITNDTLILKYTETQLVLNQIIQKLEQTGYPLAKVQLDKLNIKKNSLIADISITLNHQRKINHIILKHDNEVETTKIFPSNYLSNIKKRYKNEIYNQKNIDAIQTEFEKYPFIKQSKPPEVLLSKDSTIVYIYLDKRKTNTFDGFLGVSNDKNQKATLNGYLDIQLQNLLRKGEEFFIYWKSDGNDQKNFRTGITLHYIFNTPLGINAQLNIFKQDSTFQNAKALLDINYHINYNTKIYAGIENTSSSDIQNTNSAISDYKNQFVTVGVNHQKNSPNTPFFPEKTKIDFRFGLGKREIQNTITNISNQNQYFINLNLSHNFIINTKNSINVRSQNSYLKSNNYLTNELFQFGGLYSVRGFAENSLQANIYSSVLTEYRYFINPSIYIHSVLDYSFFKDESLSIINNKINITNSIGLGTAILTKNGLIKLVLTNGRVLKNEFKLNNSVLNISYNVKF